MRVRLHCHSLDRALAAGGEPGAGRELALRATQLAGPATRRRLARSLREVVFDAEHPSTALLTSTVPVARSAVVPLREGLLGLAERLERPGPVNPCGVARVAELLSDSRGPLYHPAPQRSLQEALWWVADGLQPCPPHAWASPVIMKLDPEHVAWTCARCGAIATTDDPSVRPE
jgi:hypothetical protein